MGYYLTYQSQIPIPLVNRQYHLQASAGALRVPLAQPYAVVTP